MRQDVDGNSLDFAQVSATTSLAAGVMTILFGLVARLPFAFAAGLGINSFLATTVVGSLTWPEAMGLVVINGIIIVILAATGLRTLIFDAVPMQLKLAITAGIGAFILFIGLVDAGFIGSTGLPSPPVGLGTGGIGSISTVPTLVFVFTLLLTGVLVVRQVRGGIFIGLVAGTVVAVVIEAIWHLGSAVERPRWLEPVGARRCPARRSPCPTCRWSARSASTASAASACWPPSCSCSRWCSRTSSTRWAPSPDCRARRASPTNAGTFPRLRSALIVEGAGAVVGGATSSSSNTVFLESAAGIEEGARTGLANLVTGVLFFAAMFVTPLASIVPTEVAAAALVIVGVMMLSHLRDIDLSEFSVAAAGRADRRGHAAVASRSPTASVSASSHGSSCARRPGKAREISPLLWIVAAGFLVYFARGWIESLIGM